MSGNFKSRMETLLKERGMTQRELAARLGVSAVTVSRWMTSGANGRNPSIRTLQRIAEVLETEPYHLLGKDTENTVSWGTLLAGTALTATAVIGIVALAKAMGKLDERDKKQIEDILNRE